MYTIYHCVGYYFYFKILLNYPKSKLLIQHFYNNMYTYKINKNNFAIINNINSMTKLTMHYC